MAQLTGAIVLERDIHGNFLASWQYPELDPELEQVMLARWSATLAQPATFSRFRGQWFYISSLQLDTLESRLPKVSHAAVAVLSDGFNPEKFLALSKVMLSLYLKAGHPLTILQCYLAVFMKGKWQEGDLSFDSAAYPDESSHTASSLKDTIRMFGEETILIWCAMLMKKRVAVVSEDVPTLLKVVRTLPLLVSHRPNYFSTNLWPVVTTLPLEMADLTSSGVYTAGFISREALGPSDDAYDVLIDVGQQSVSVAAHAQESFALGRIHKDIASYMTDSVASDAGPADAAFIEGLQMRTQNIIAKLETLKAPDSEGGKGSYVTMDQLHSVGKVGPPLDRFLFAVAQAEDMTKRAATEEAPQ
jgi:hypothetical protein